MPPMSPFSDAKLGEQIVWKQKALVNSATPVIHIHGHLELGPHPEFASQR